MKIQRPFVMALLVGVAVCGQAFGVRQTPTKKLHSSKHSLRHSRWNPMFRPSHESLLKQNEEIDRLELPRIADNDQLEELKLSEALVPINASQFVRFDPRLDPQRRFCRSWTRDFVDDLGEAY